MMRCWEKDTKNCAPGIFFGPSYFETALNTVKREKNVSNLELRRLKLLLSTVLIQKCFLLGGDWKSYFYSNQNRTSNVPFLDPKQIWDFWVIFDKT